MLVLMLLLLLGENCQYNKTRSRLVPFMSLEDKPGQGEKRREAMEGKFGSLQGVVGWRDIVLGVGVFEDLGVRKGRGLYFYLGATKVPRYSRYRGCLGMWEWKLDCLGKVKLFDRFMIVLWHKKFIGCFNVSLELTQLRFELTNITQFRFATSNAASSHKTGYCAIKLLAEPPLQVDFNFARKCGWSPLEPPSGDCDCKSYSVLLFHLHFKTYLSFLCLSTLCPMSSEVSAGKIRVQAALQSPFEVVGSEGWSYNHFNTDNLLLICLISSETLSSA